ncbi:MAG TPA: trypsin-like peptidase domain-containing protein [Chitinophagales bacterium]|nr:trypsin-like peptidase domain-containing protein [Chitinophagales bacterium]
MKPNTTTPFLKQLTFSIVLAVLCSVISVQLMSRFSLLWQGIQRPFLPEHVPYPTQIASSVGSFPVTIYGRGSYLQTQDMVAGSFIDAAKTSTPTVVNISTSKFASGNNTLNNPFGDIFGEKNSDWFGYETPNRGNVNASSGSGVIVSSDGYILTNNHVIAGSAEIQVTLYDKRTFTAVIVGTDAATDLALLRINANNLPAIRYGNSDELQVGEWVLAVGNPFNLASTVTAGIVSAKGRNINILKEEASVEAFIQTDAAVNQGNSGGALVNLQGNLVGINTAIATPSGTYAGYAFAVPVNIAVKVIEDLKTYGTVQRAFLGINTRDITPEIANKLKLKNLNGIYVDYVAADGAGAEAGLQKEDIITEINGYRVDAIPEFKEKIARFRPGDIIGITYLRNGQMKYTKMTLQNAIKTTKIIANPSAELEKILGAQFTELTLAELSNLGVKSGLKITRLTNNGTLSAATSVKVGFVVLKVNNEPVKTAEQLFKIIQQIPSGDGVMFGGFYPSDKQNKTYAFTMPPL